MDRDDRLKEQKGRGIVRALHESELANAGADRADALLRAEYALERIARQLLDALDAGLGMTEIAQLTGVSRPTLYELRARYSDSSRDLRLAVMQALMRRETSFPDALPGHLGRPMEEIRPILEEFEERGWIELNLDEGEPRGVPEGARGAIVSGSRDDMHYPYGVSWAGYEALERWRFEGEHDRDESAERA